MVTHEIKNSFFTHESDLLIDSDNRYGTLNSEAINLESKPITHCQYFGRGFTIDSSSELYSDCAIVNLAFVCKGTGRHERSAK